MADAYIGEIRSVAFNFAPRNWTYCNGQTLSISQNTALFSLIGTFYGGNGTSNFAVPNMANRMPMHQGTGQGLSSYVIGQQSGAAGVTLNVTQIPAHTHSLNGGIAPGSTGQSSGTPSNTAYLSNSSPGSVWINTATSLIGVAQQAITVTGGSQAHENRSPFLAMNFIICLNGVFPSRN